ncbi:MAG: NYN domain-containing protein [Gaiellales bacterium]
MLYLFDGSNILHAGPFRDRQALVDRLASFVALQGARGVVVFDGHGEEEAHGPLEVRYAAHADDVIERLAAEHRERERVVIVSSDRAIRQTAGQEVSQVPAERFLGELERTLAERQPHVPDSKVEDALDAATRAQLEEWRRRR